MTEAPGGALQAALQYAQENRERFLSELIEFVRIPSVSTDPERKGEMQAAAEWVAGQLRGLGFSGVQVYPTPGHPVVYGERLDQPGAPVILVYGHYDVQPAEPLELWDSPAFEPAQRGENLFGRGVSDMKGQVVASLKAVESVLRAAPNEGLPVNVKFLVEGEEEIGSPNLGAFLTGNRELLACDFCLNPDAGMIDPDNPSITYGLRGLAYFELRVKGPQHDLHSGIFGGAVHNPAQVLCELIAGMHDEQGRITLPGYYDSVRPLSQEERDELARLPMDEAFYKQAAGVERLYGEAGYTPVEQVGARPTLEVNGLLSGFTGEGSKTVLPAWAMAKISMRLVPDQDPAEVHRQLVAYLEQKAPPTVTWEVTQMAGGRASLTDRETAGVKAMAHALRTVWGKRPLYKREGGSIPVVGDMQELLGIRSIVCGFGLMDDNAHGPNEKQHLPTWERGIQALIHFFYNLEL